MGSNDYWAGYNAGSWQNRPSYNGGGAAREAFEIVALAIGKGIVKTLDAMDEVGKFHELPIFASAEDAARKGLPPTPPAEVCYGYIGTNPDKGHKFRALTAAEEMRWTSVYWSARVTHVRETGNLPNHTLNLRLYEEGALRRELVRARASLSAAVARLQAVEDEARACPDHKHHALVAPQPGRVDARDGRPWTLAHDLEAKAFAEALKREQRRMAGRAVQVAAVRSPDEQQIPFEDRLAAMEKEDRALIFNGWPQGGWPLPGYESARPVAVASAREAEAVDLLKSSLVGLSERRTGQRAKLESDAVRTDAIAQAPLNWDDQLGIDAKLAAEAPPLTIFRMAARPYFEAWMANNGSFQGEWPEIIQSATRDMLGFGFARRDALEAVIIAGTPIDRIPSLKSGQETPAGFAQRIIARAEAELKAMQVAAAAPPPVRSQEY